MAISPVIRAGTLVIVLASALFAGPSSAMLLRAYGSGGGMTVSCATILVNGPGTIVFTGSSGALIDKVGC